MKLIEENMEHNLKVWGPGNGFSDAKSKAQSTKEGLINWKVTKMNMCPP